MINYFKKDMLINRFILITKFFNFSTQNLTEEITVGKHGFNY